MDEVVFDTEQEALNQQAVDYDFYIAGCDCPLYVSQTVKWALPRQRLDGKWAYPVCPGQDYTGMTVESHNPANYPTEEN